MKKKLLTIFGVFAVIVAMMLSVIACTPKGGGGTTGGGGGGGDQPGGDDIDYDEIATTSATALKDGVVGLMKAALDSSKEKSYDATIFVKVQVGEGKDATNVDVKLRVAATFGAENKGLLDVTVGGTSYVTLYTANNLVYLGEALTQADKKWFKVDAAQEGGIIDKFFPQLLTVLNEKEDSNGDNLYKKAYSTISSYLTFVPTIVSFLYPKAEGGVVIKDLGNGVVQYSNTVTFSEIAGLLSSLSGIGVNIEDLLSGLGDYQGLIDKVCNIIFGGPLNALLGKDGASIPADAAPAITLNYTSKNSQLTDLELTYANDFAFDSENSEEKTAVSVAFGLENVNITTDSKTAILDAETQKAVNAAEEPAIKLTIEAEVPGKDVGATVEAYVVPKATVGATECYSVPTKYAQTYYTTDKVTTSTLAEKSHKCKDNCKHTLGEVKDMEENHKCAMPNGLCVHSDLQYGDMTATHKCLNSKCKHYYNINKFNFEEVVAYAIAKDKDGSAVNLGCTVDASQLKDNGTGEIVLKFELAGLYDLLKIENTNNLPTQFQKTFKMWDDEKQPEGEEGEEGEEEEVQNASLLADEATTTITNTIDKVFDAFSGGFDFGKVMGLLDPVLKFAKVIINDIVTPNVTTDEATKTATLNVAAILKGLVENDTIKGSEKLKINGEDNITAYLKNLAGVAGLVDNIMRASVKVEEGQEKPAVNSKYDVEKLTKLVEDYAGIAITDAAFTNTTLELTGIRGEKTADDGLGFSATLKSEGKTVLTLTMKVDIVGADTVPAQEVIGEDFDGAELEKVLVQDTEEDGTPKVDADNKPVMIEVDGEALNNINALAQEILKAYRGDEEAAA